MLSSGQKRAWTSAGGRASEDGRVLPSCAMACQSASTAPSVKSPGIACDGACKGTTCAWRSLRTHPRALCMGLSLHMCTHCLLNSTPTSRWASKPRLRYPTALSSWAHTDATVHNWTRAVATESRDLNIQATVHHKNRAHPYLLVTYDNRRVKVAVGLGWARLRTRRVCRLGASVPSPHPARPIWLQNADFIASGDAHRQLVSLRLLVGGIVVVNLSAQPSAAQPSRTCSLIESGHNKRIFQIIYCYLYCRVNKDHACQYPRRWPVQAPALQPWEYSWGAAR